MRLPLRLALAVGAIVGAQPACGSTAPTQPTYAEVDGNWLGGTVSNGFALQLAMTLAEDSHGITGTGTLSGSGPSCDASISGSRHSAAITLSIACPGFIPIGFTGQRRNDSTINGHVTGSGLPTTPFDLLTQ
jgi:hypothetical protein